MKVITGITELRQHINAERQAGNRIAFVPTMGNLHAGHLHLVEQAKLQADLVIVSIFVNPTQFGVGEDFSSYPRTEQQDQQKLAQVGAHVLFLPSVESMYPPGMRTVVSVHEISELHCGKSRVGHFSGVATIVTKLFNMVQADVALFGRKDFQQLAVIRNLVKDLNMTVEIVGVDTVRESDGLAMSSRNAYLNEAQRKIANRLYSCLLAAKQAIIAGQTDFKVIQQQQHENLQQAGFETEYFSICRADNLQVTSDFEVDLVILVAAKLGKARLIDNIEIKRAEMIC